MPHTHIYGATYQLNSEAWMSSQYSELHILVELRRQSRHCLHLSAILKVP